jgi:hypothetical protein
MQLVAGVHCFKKTELLPKHAQMRGLPAIPGVNNACGRAAVLSNLDILTPFSQSIKQAVSHCSTQVIPHAM